MMKTMKPRERPTDSVLIDDTLTTTLIRGDAMRPKPDDLLAQVVTRPVGEILPRNDGWSVVGRTGIAYKVWARVTLRVGLPQYPPKTPA